MHHVLTAESRNPHTNVGEMWGFLRRAGPPDYDRRMELNRIITSNVHLIAAEPEDLQLLAAILRTDVDTAAEKLTGTTLWNADDIGHLATYYQVEPAAFALLSPQDAALAGDT